MDMGSAGVSSVLIVTNEEDVRECAARSLTGRRCNVMLADNGPKALDVLKQRAVDLMVADMGSEHIPGVHLSQAASRMFPDLAIVLLVDETGIEAARMVVGCGASDYISKPISDTQLILVIERGLQKRRADAELLSNQRSQTLFSAIKSLAAAIDAKSDYTATHSGRVVGLCASAAKTMRLSETDTATLELAAQIHDVGNIGTPDEALNKPGALSDVEWVDILRHPDVGSSMIAHVPALSHIASIIRHHHERYDGNGYPDGLKAEAIPLLSRIISVADAYEAMTADRPYRLAKTHQEAIRELRINSGKQFDPSVLEHFIAAVDDLEATRKAA